MRREEANPTGVLIGDGGLTSTAYDTTRPRCSMGSVRARASQYRLSWDGANPRSCGLQNGQHGRGPPEEKQSPAVGGHMLMVAGARTEEVAEFIVSPAEPGR